MTERMKSSAATIMAATPVRRDRYVDLLRAFSLCVVVLGHWLLAVVRTSGGTITGGNALAVLPGLHALTWVLQVMPLFFFAGGFANLTSWRATVRRGEGYADFLRRRLARLLRPTAVFAAVWAGIALALRMAGLPADRVALLVGVVTIPLWFLVVYVILVSVAPAMAKLHERFGARVPVALAATALCVDVLSRGLGVPWVGTLNFAIVWLLPHQLGYFYADGSLLRAGRRAHRAMAAGSLAALVTLTSVGPYAVSMVGVPGARSSNNSPPSFALAIFGVWLIGAAMLVRPAALRWLERPAVWATVVRLNLIAMTMFLWHMTALVLGALVLLPLGFPQPAAGTATWWATRPVWEALLVAVLAGFVFAFGSVEADVPSAPSVSASAPRLPRR